MSLFKSFIRKVFGGTSHYSSPGTFRSLNSAGYGTINNRSAQDMLLFVKWLNKVHYNQPKGEKWYWWWEREVTNTNTTLERMNGVVINYDAAIDYIRTLNGVK